MPNKTPRLPPTVPADLRVSTHHVCPVCRSAMFRVRRRGIDRLLSRFVPVRRYRCTHFPCQWEGNMRADRGTAVNQESDGHVPMPTGFIVNMGIVVVGVVAMVVFGLSEALRDADPVETNLAQGESLNRVVMPTARR